MHLSRAEINLSHRLASLPTTCHHKTMENGAVSVSTSNKSRKVPKHWLIPDLPTDLRPQFLCLGGQLKRLKAKAKLAAAAAAPPAAPVATEDAPAEQPSVPEVRWKASDSPATAS